jgi:hypothetical protein
MKRWLVAAVSLVTVVGGMSATATSSQYQEIQDSSEALKVEVPDDWNDIDPSTSPEGFQRLLASPNLQSASDNWDTPRVALFAHKGTNVGSALEAAGQEAGTRCQLYGQATWSNRKYSGQMKLYRNCNNKGGEFLAIGAHSDEGFVVGIGVLTMGEADKAASRHIQNTFDVVGEVTG